MSSAFYEISGEKKWRILDDLSPEAVAGKEALTQALGIDPVVSRLLWNRGYRTPDAFLSVVSSFKPASNGSTSMVSTPYLKKRAMAE